MTSTAEQNARYLADPRQCVDCGGHPAAGMPRCYSCHDIWKAAQLPPPPPFVIEITWTDKQKAKR